MPWCHFLKSCSKWCVVVPWCFSLNACGCCICLIYFCSTIDLSQTWSAPSANRLIVVQVAASCFSRFTSAWSAACSLVSCSSLAWRVLPSGLFWHRRTRSWSNDIKCLFMILMEIPQAHSTQHLACPNWSPDMKWTKNWWLRFFSSTSQLLNPNRAHTKLCPILKYGFNFNAMRLQQRPSTSITRITSLYSHP